MTECIFCKIAAKKIPSTIVAETDMWVAFRDINPQAPTHILIIPRKHLERLADAASEDRELLGELLLAAREVAQKEGLEKEGYRVVINNGPFAGQSVYHLHVHVLGGRPLGWPPG